MSIADDDGDPRFDADKVTGMFISMMFAGHHTTSGTAAWTLIELLRHPDEMAAVVAELDELYADGAEVSYQALREMPRLEAAIKEALRLHPPLILLLRVANVDLEVGGRHIAGREDGGGQPGGVEPPRPRPSPTPTRSGPAATSTTRPPTPPTRGTGSRSAPAATAASAPQFAMMQLKAIFSVLLKDWTFEAAQPLDSYRNDHSKMVVQLAQPCLATYRRRTAGAADAGATSAAADRHRALRRPARAAVRGLAHRGRPRPVPGPRRLRGRGARPVLGVQAGRAHRRSTSARPTTPAPPPRPP